MARKTLREKLEEQKAAVEELEQALSDLKSKLASSPGPLVLTVATNRLTGRFAMTMTVDQVNPEPDVRLLLEVVQQVARELSEELIRLAECRVRREVEGQGEQEEAKGQGKE